MNRALLLGVMLSQGSCKHPGEVASKQEAVEHGLLPAIIVTDQPAPAWQIDERMERYHVPGVSIAVINGGKIAWAKGYGVTRANANTPVTDSTLFQAASIAKVVSATGALRLVQNGVLTLDTDIDLLLRSWKIPTNQYTRAHPVTLRELLSHRAGVTVEGFTGYALGDSLPNLRQILNGESPANSAPIRVDALPGSQYRYSGGGYEVLQQLVEDATGQSFIQVMQAQVLTPAGMANSTFMLPLSDRHKAMAACGHTSAGVAFAGCWNRYPETAAAWLWTTPSDLASLGIALSEAARGVAEPILDSGIVAQMLAKDADEMGLGPGVHGEGNTLFFDHAGWNHGFRTYMMVYPYLGQGIVVMANGDDGNLLIDEIRRSVARACQWPDFAPQQRVATTIDSAALSGRVGEYEVREYGLVLSVRQEGDHLIIDTPRGSWYTFYPVGKNKFFAIEDGSELKFAKVSGDGPPMLYLWGMTAVRRAAP